MRLLIAMLVVLGAACAPDEADTTCAWNGRTYERGDVFPAGDGCNNCSCTQLGIECTLVACFADAGPASCVPTLGCAVGPRCGDVCCDTGEQCVNDACQCGANAACGAGDECAAAGPIGDDACGAICCGASGPCPQ